MNKITHAALAVLLGAAVYGCDEKKPAPAQPVARQASSDSGGATMAAQPARGSCPPTLTAPARADGAPVDDVIGIRPGQSYDDVAAILACHKETPMIQTVDRWRNDLQTFGIPTRQAVRATDGQECNGQEIFRSMSSVSDTGGCPSDGSFKVVKNTTDQIYVVFTGLQGKEIAGAVWRSRRFPEAERPTADSLKQSLAEKYGQPHQVSQDQWGTNLVWLYDTAGRPMSESNPGFRQCNSVFPKFQSGHSWSPACGLTIRALIEPVRTNDLLVNQFHIVAMHQQQFFEAGERFAQELVTENERVKKEQAQHSNTKVGEKDL
jgi:hypothetical protein